MVNKKGGMPSDSELDYAMLALYIYLHAFDFAKFFAGKMVAKAVDKLDTLVGAYIYM